MKLVKIDPFPEFYYTCKSCKGSFSSTKSLPGYADLHGKPYNAYYCNYCGKMEIKKENKKPVYLKKLLYRIPGRETGYDRSTGKQYWKYIWSDGTKGEGSLYDSQREGLSCDVELGSVGDTMKYGTIFIVGGGLAYAMWKFKLFGGLKWLTDAFRDFRLAPKTIAIFEDAELNTRADQIEKIFSILKQKADNFSVDYGSLYGEWLALKSQIKTGEESFKRTVYESSKETYFGSKSRKEKMRDRLDSFRTKALQAMRLLQNKKGFKISGNWQIIGNLNCIPCLF